MESEKILCGTIIALALFIGLLVLWCRRSRQRRRQSGGENQALIAMEAVMYDRWAELRQRELEAEIRRMAELLERPVCRNFRNAVTKVRMERSQSPPSIDRVYIPGNILLMEANQMESDVQQSPDSQTKILRVTRRAGSTGEPE